MGILNLTKLGTREFCITKMFLSCVLPEISYLEMILSSQRILSDSLYENQKRLYPESHFPNHSIRMLFGSSI